jgi:hypothetical protein
MLGILLVSAALIGGGWSLWYWSAPIGAWIAGLGRETETEAELEPAPIEVAPEVEPPPTPPAELEKVFGIRGAPDDAGPELPTEPELPVEPQTPPTEPELPVEPQTPAAPRVSTTIQSTATKVRGKVSGAAVASRLALVDAALPSCWADAIEAGATGPVELELSLGIRWSGHANGIGVSGGSDALDKCVRAAVPGAGWPKPRDGGDASVTRRWTLGG